MQLGVGVDWMHRSENSSDVISESPGPGGTTITTQRQLSQSSSNLFPMMAFVQVSADDKMPVIPYFGVAGGYQVLFLSDIFPTGYFGADIAERFRSMDRRVVQANDIDIDPLSRTAVVGYNYAGEEFAGALQVIDFRLADHPVLLSEVVWENADVDAVCKRGVAIDAGLSSADPALATPAARV